MLVCFQFRGVPLTIVSYYIVHHIYCCCCCWCCCFIMLNLSLLYNLAIYREPSRLSLNHHVFWTFIWTSLTPINPRWFTFEFVALIKGEVSLLHANLQLVVSLSWTFFKVSSPLCILFGESIIFLSISPAIAVHSLLSEGDHLVWR